MISVNEGKLAGMTILSTSSLVMLWRMIDVHISDFQSKLAVKTILTNNQKT